MRFLLLLLLAPLPAATVCGLDGVQHQGELVLSSDRVQIGGVSLALADCDWLRFDQQAEESRRTPAAARFGVVLVDGSWFPAARVEAGSRDDTVQVDGLLGRFELPLASLIGWATGELPAPGLEDALVVNGQALGGRVRGLKGGRLLVGTPLQEDPLPLVLAEVQALRLSQPVRPSSGLRLSVRLDPLRPPLALLPGPRLAFAAAPSAQLDPVRLGGATCRIDGPRRVWLSDLVPVSVQEEGAFGVIWPWRKDADLDGAPLLLGGELRVKGLTVHSRARLTWKLDRSYQRLRAAAGLADAVGLEGDCAASLAADGKGLWQRASIRGGDPVEAIDLDVSGVSELTLNVDYGARHDIADHFVLADAYLVRR